MSRTPFRTPIHEASFSFKEDCVIPNFSLSLCETPESDRRMELDTNKENEEVNIMSNSTPKETHKPKSVQGIRFVMNSSDNNQQRQDMLAFVVGGQYYYDKELLSYILQNQATKNSEKRKGIKKLIVPEELYNYLLPHQR